MGYDLLENGDSFPITATKSKDFMKEGYVNSDGAKNILKYHPNVIIARALGVGKGRRRALKEGESVSKKYPALSPKSNCQDVMDRLFELQTEMDAIRGKITAGEKSKWYKNALGVLEQRMADAKVLYNKLRCVEQQLEKEAASEKAEVIDVLTQSTDVSTRAGSGKGINKYVIFGIGGLLVLGGIFILLKDKK
jgi:hypothetical protein